MCFPCLVKSHMLQSEISKLHVICQQLSRPHLPGVDPGMVKRGGGLAPCEVKCPPRVIWGHAPPENFGIIH